MWLGRAGKTRADVLYFCVCRYGGNSEQTQASPAPRPGGAALRKAKATPNAPGGWSQRGARYGASSTGKRFVAFISRRDRLDRMLATPGSVLNTVSTKRL